MTPTYWHAVHPSPYDDACPTCTGYDLTEGAVAATGSWLTALVLTLAALAAVLLLWRWLK